YVQDQEKQARTVEIEAEITDRDGNNLLPGYSADVEVLLDTRDNVIRVPTQVVMDGSRVMILDEDGILRTREISRGLSNWEFTEITAGLDTGERVVLSIDREGVADGVAAVAE
ncbi:MAG: efflux RND transporter periplasmic adaptor subunit, partial [Gammaproteobacteria bacterium]|nr:efflux RND transporter periplasmic adaptor subunit [Gammaproteobacteria bacterium]